MVGKVSIKELARQVEDAAKSKGYTSITPSEEFIIVNEDCEGVCSIDFTLRKGNNYAGTVSVIVKDSNKENQTVTPVSKIVVN